MRVLLFANNWVGWKVAEWLRAQGTDIVGLVLHPREGDESVQEIQRYGEEIERAVALDPSRVFDGSLLQEQSTLDAIGDLRPDIGVSAFFSYALTPACIPLFPQGCVVLYPGFLPFNRGINANVWSIIERTPTGVTVYFADGRGVNTGDIVLQREVPAEITDTGETLYRKLERASVELFREAWPLVLAGNPPRTPQSGEGTIHIPDDVKKRGMIDLDASYKARDLIDLLRARTFPPHPGACFIHEGRKIYLGLQLLSGEQLLGRQPLPLLTLREATADDAKPLWEWVQDPDVRAVSFSAGPSSWDEHVRWLMGKLRDPRCHLFIGLDEHGEAVGQVRFDCHGDHEADVSVIMDRAHRGRGFGSLIIATAVLRLFRETDVKLIHAFIKPWHRPSIRTFTKAGFTETESATVRGSPALHFVRRKS